MIYTCYEMVRDCRADLPEGWSFFVSNYVPVVRKLLAHYGPDDQSSLEDVLLALRNPQSSLFQSPEPPPERWFIAELRQQVVARIPSRTPALAVDLETVGAALAPLTVVEKQAAWFETMRYSADDSAAMLRMASTTAANIRARAAELLRQEADAWSESLLVENGPQLNREAAARSGPDCRPVKTFLDIIDGRMTWRGREDLDRHVGGCWHCVDHFCRMLEVVELLRGVQPLGPDEAEPFRALLGVAPVKKKHWWRG